MIVMSSTWYEIDLAVRNFETDPDRLLVLGRRRPPRFPPRVRRTR